MPRKASGSVRSTAVRSNGSKWLAIHNHLPHYLCIEGEDFAFALAPQGYPGDFAVLDREELASHPAIQAQVRRGTVSVVEHDTYPVSSEFPDYLPDDQWARQAVIDVVLAGDSRALSIIHLSPSADEMNSEETVRRWIATELRDILSTAARWLQERGDERSRARLAMVNERLEQIRKM